MSDELICDVCGSCDLSTSDIGQLVCDTCGTQSQSYVEEQEEFEGVEYLVGRRARKAAPKVVEEEEDENEVDDTDFRAHTTAYVEGIQTILQMQCDALVEHHGCHPSLQKVVRRIWFAYLSKKRLLSTSFLKKHTRLRAGNFGLGPLNKTKTAAEHPGPNAAAQDEEADLEGSAAARDQAGSGQEEEEAVTEGEENEEDPDGFQWHWRGAWRTHQPITKKIAQQIQLNQLMKKLEQEVYLDMTLALCYLGCVWLREAVLTADLVRWAVEGRLPFMSAHSHLSQEVRLAAPWTRLCPRDIPSASDVDIAASTLLQELQLQMPPLNVPLLVRKCLLELGLEEGLLEPICRLHSLLSHPDVWLEGRPVFAIKQPQKHIMALVLVTLSLLYATDSSEAPCRALPPPPSHVSMEDIADDEAWRKQIPSRPRDWEVWASKSRARMRDEPLVPIHPSQHVMSEVFGGYPPLPNQVEYFERLHARFCSSPTAPQAPLEDAPQLSTSGDRDATARMRVAAEAQGAPGPPCWATPRAQPLPSEVDWGGYIARLWPQDWDNGYTALMERCAAYAAVEVLALHAAVKELEDAMVLKEAALRTESHRTHSNAKGVAPS
ncbi:hypothetical protein CYMTET_34639 [Cymbomonas tetramitiformis]|uniref:TATA box-binding protein-associated factor RNA polymerase I subunit B n=1 Tax=Cymbomonas tetramitiformis TaxID=36881 RepID=A0AAE0FAY1_9CHLO|nr:hypothetical protein CYMTET_34639 [Cymbomonas tetramitiformis]